MQVPGDEKPVIKAGYHPLLLGFFWVLILSMIVLVLQRPDRDMILIDNDNGSDFSRFSAEHHVVR